MENLYDVLNIDQKSDYDTIKKAYRKLSLLHHPDRNKSISSNNIFQKINTAYDILSNNTKRLLYDEQLINSNFKYQLVTRNGLDLNDKSNENLNSNLNDKSNENFNSNLNENLNIYKEIYISLEDSFLSNCIPINLEKWRFENNYKVYFNETIYVNINKGTDNNEIIIIENKGNYINENKIGKIEITIRLKKHQYFERNGLDLIFNKEISLKQALCGFNFDLHYLDDNIYKIKNEKGNIINNNYKKIIKSKGFQREDKIGNLIIYFNVIFPNNLSNEQIEQLSEIL